MKQLLFILFLGSFSGLFGQEKDSAEVLIEGLIIFNKDYSNFPFSDKFELMLYEDDSLIYIAKGDSSFCTFELKEDSLGNRLLKLRKDYDIVIIEQPSLYLGTKNSDIMDNFTTKGITNHTRIIRDIKRLSGCDLGHKDFFFNEDKDTLSVYEKAFVSAWCDQLEKDSSINLIIYYSAWRTTSYELIAQRLEVILEEFSTCDIDRTRIKVEFYQNYPDKRFLFEEEEIPMDYGNIFITKNE